MDATLAYEFGLDISDTVGEEEMLAALEARLASLMQADPMKLVQILYGLDVDERAAEAAMDEPDAASRLAHLILQRTKAKAATRAAFRPQPASDEDTDLRL